MARIYDWDDPRHDRNIGKLQAQWAAERREADLKLDFDRRFAEWKAEQRLNRLNAPAAPMTDLEVVSRTIELPALSMRAEVTGTGGDREVSVRFATSTPVARLDYVSGVTFDEVLSMDPKHVRLDRLNAGAPVLASHRQDSLKDVLGVVIEGSATISIASGGRARLRFSRRPDVEPYFQDIKDGIIRGVSVGYRVHRFQETKSANGGRPTWTAIDWEPYEVSMVAIPADDKSGVGRAGTRCAIIEAPATRITTDEDRARWLRLARAQQGAA